MQPLVKSLKNASFNFEVNTPTKQDQAEEHITSETRLRKEVQRTSAYLRYLVECKRIEVKNHHYRDEWIFAAIVFDRFCGIIIIAIMCITLAASLLVI